MGENKSIRAMIVAALPIYIGVALARYGVGDLYAAGIAAALIGFSERAWRLVRARYPESATVAWLFGVEQTAPSDVK